MKKSLLFSVAFIAFATFAPQSAMGDTVGVIIVKTDGSMHEHEFEAINRLEIGEKTVTIHHATAEPTEHNMSEIDRIKIAAQLSGIQSAVAEGSLAVWPTAVETDVNIAGAEAGTAVNIYSMSGSNVQQGTIDADGTLSLNLSQLQKGTYVLTIGSTSVKILKK